MTPEYYKTALTLMAKRLREDGHEEAARQVEIATEALMAGQGEADVRTEEEL